jgi:hypothetical protein
MKVIMNQVEHVTLLLGSKFDGESVLSYRNRETMAHKYKGFVM